MKVRLFFSLMLVIFCSIFNEHQAQEVSCSELLEFIEKNGYEKGNMSTLALQSTWLYKVTAYSYKMKTYIVAKIKANEYSIATNSYVFCAVPDRNWQNFKSWNISGDDNYGEKFHENIMPYKCNCY